ncbi:hypothetical protein [Gardnerella vaginalis]|uniref:hypothetical protein n=1 Tax=Gardnerella vaginalis TaxID=2702 RepID=UPI00200C67B8|nr:hypothetical protein [Gardnerella vaginalis]UQA81843.1 hypothetical protein K9E42_04890 [Gardnerella vaginalis]UQA84404.1 hypothetical protein K9E40_05060 [Gardnerella vaginalis]
MMNKKAIAAFAAGATLLAGFAMATPAMAESLIPMYNQNNGFAEVSDGTDASVLKATIEQDKQEIKAAEDWNDKVSSAYANANTNTATVTVDGVVPADSSQATHVLVLGNDGKLSVVVEANAVTQAQVDALMAAANKAEAAVDAAKKKLADDEAALAKLESKKVTPKKDDKKDDTTTPDQKIKDLGKLNLSDAAKKKLAVHYVYKAKLALDEADNNLAEKKADYAAKRKTLLETMTELAARKAAAEKANQDLTDFLASGENNSAKETALRDALNRAHAHEQRAFDAEQKAEAEFNAARDAAFAAVAAYNKALAEYKDAYNDAVRLGVNPAALPPVVTSDPLAADFPAVPGTKQIYADALNGKFGPAAQASAKKTEVAKAQAAAPAAAGKTAAKGELAAKGGNGHGKAGEKLGNAGVGVALTALAASMLAGMGAAVRKMRH